MSGHDGFLDAAARKQAVQPFIDDTLFDWIDTLLMTAARDADLQSDAQEFERARGQLHGWVAEHRAFAIPVDADREREEPVVSQLELDSLGPIAEIMRASARLLREVEEMERVRASGAELIAAAPGGFEAGAKLREQFDKWLPGWDTDEAGLDLN